MLHYMLDITYCTLGADQPPHLYNKYNLYDMYYSHTHTHTHTHIHTYTHTHDNIIYRPI